MWTVVESIEGRATLDVSTTSNHARVVALVGGAAYGRTYANEQIARTDPQWKRIKKEAK
jgi:hypothetical protein